MSVTVSVSCGNEVREIEGDSFEWKYAGNEKDPMGSRDLLLFVWAGTVEHQIPKERVIDATRLG